MALYPAQHMLQAIPSLTSATLTITTTTSTMDITSLPPHTSATWTHLGSAQTRTMSTPLSGTSRIRPQPIPGSLSIATSIGTMVTAGLMGYFRPWMARTRSPVPKILWLCMPSRCGVKSPSHPIWNTGRPIFNHQGFLEAC